MGDRQAEHVVRVDRDRARWTEPMARAAAGLNGACAAAGVAQKIAAARTGTYQSIAPFWHSGGDPQSHDAPGRLPIALYGRKALGDASWST